MPIYEYQCSSCHRVTEILQKMSESPLEVCPECGGKVSKLMSMNTFHLKGSGWYVTDYSGKKAPETKTESSSSCSTASESSSSSSSSDGGSSSGSSD